MRRDPTHYLTVSRGRRPGPAPLATPPGRAVSSPPPARCGLRCRGVEEGARRRHRRGVHSFRITDGCSGGGLIDDRLLRREACDQRREGQVVHLSRQAAGDRRISARSRHRRRSCHPAQPAPGGERYNPRSRSRPGRRSCSGSRSADPAQPAPRAAAAGAAWAAPATTNRTAWSGPCEAVAFESIPPLPGLSASKR